MKKLIPLVGAICGVLSGIGMICGGIMDGKLPKPAWIFIGIGFFISAIANVYNYRYFHKNQYDK